MRSCSFQQEQNKEPWKAVSSSQWNCVRVWEKFSSLPPEEIYCSYFCQSFDTYFNKGFILDIYLSALLSHAHKQNASKLSVLCIDSTRATESMEHLLPFYQLSPSLVYPASRGYIFVVWDSVRKVASADNRSIFTKRHQGQNSVSNRMEQAQQKASSTYLRQVQHIEKVKRHSVSRRGTAYWGQAQRKDSSTYLGQVHRITDRHGVSGTSEGEWKPRIP